MFQFTRPLRASDDDTMWDVVIRDLASVYLSRRDRPRLLRTRAALPGLKMLFHARMP
jgi:hypothetical protein